MGGKQIIKGCVLGSLGSLLLLAVAGLALLKSGYLEPGADVAPSKLESGLAKTALDASLSRRVSSEEAPFPASTEVLLSGLEHYENHCAACHGHPSVPNGTFGKSLYPRAPQFSEEITERPTNEVRWIIQHGIRRSGMPAFQDIIPEKQIWELTLFITNLEKLPPEVHEVWDNSRSDSSETLPVPKK